ncbi:MAG TPA: hypothetical protein VF017_11165 [Thermoanaerobaculia bacterium]|nr:hypothetical protein [Thermoanaerobaculia bacterium]
MTRSRLILLTLALSLLAAPTFAADSVIVAGIDLFRTLGNGNTHTSFADEPLPAGFFCSGSEPFTGDIAFRGVPVTTLEKGALGRTDTIVQRLDDAVFDEAGVAHTRVQVRAMEFVGLKPIRTKCGLYGVRLTLEGEQPITNMKIIREHEWGGRFEAPIHVNVKLTFHPLHAQAGEAVEVVRPVRFAANKAARWTDRPGTAGRVHTEAVVLDLDRDGIFELELPGTSNFAAGWRVPKAALNEALAKGLAPATSALAALQIQHCNDPDNCTKEHDTYSAQ